MFAKDTVFYSTHCSLSTASNICGTLLFEDTLPNALVQTWSFYLFVFYQVPELSSKKNKFYVIHSYSHMCIWINVCVSTFVQTHKINEAMNPYMQYGCGAEAAVATAKITNVENMNVWFHSCRVVGEWHAAALQIFFHTMEKFLSLLQGLCSRKWVWSAFPQSFCFC